MREIDMAKTGNWQIRRFAHRRWPFPVRGWVHGSRHASVRDACPYRSGYHGHTEIVPIGRSYPTSAEARGDIGIRDGESRKVR